MNTCFGSLSRLDHSRKSKYLNAVQMQLIPNVFRGWADTDDSSPVSLRSPRLKYQFKYSQETQKVDLEDAQLKSQVELLTHDSKIEDHDNTQVS